MDVRDLVRAHYATGDLADAVVAVLAEAGIDTDHLTVRDLAAVDQLHAGGAAATALVLERLSPAPGTSLLDIGCGLGGPSRMAADTCDVRVTGVDLTPELVVAADALAARVGLDARTRFLTTPGDTLPFEDDSFDAAMMIHVGMNVPDKLSLFDEVHRVLAPGARFVLYEQVRRGAGQLEYPLPWAADEQTSFVETVDHYVAALTDAGFGEFEIHDRTGPIPGATPPSGQLGPGAIFGSTYLEGVTNHIAATRAGFLGGVILLARI